MSLFELKDSLPQGTIMQRASTAYAPDVSGLLRIFQAGTPAFEYSAALGRDCYRSEPGYINLIPSPEDFADASWAHQQVGGDVSVDQNIDVGPDGASTADRLNFLNGASSDIGLSNAQAGLVNGDLFMTSVYVKSDTSPNDVRLKNPNSAAGVVNGTALSTWQRLSRLDTVVGTVSGLYVRRNSGLGGAIRLALAQRYVNQGGKLFSYHRGTKSPDFLRVPANDLNPSEGTIELTWIPNFAATAEQGLTETFLLDGGASSLRISWAGDDVPAYIRVYFGGSVIGTIAARHVAGQVCRLAFHWGAGLPPYLEMDGWMVIGSGSPSISASNFSVGCDLSGALQNFALFANLAIYSTRQRS